jgi:hypothetical protein
MIGHNAQRQRPSRVGKETTTIYGEPHWQAADAGNGSGRSSRGLKISSPMIASNDWLPDHRALLRWAEDGGRWAEESNVSIREVTI